MSPRLALPLAVLVGLLVLLPLVTVGWMSFAGELPRIEGPYTLSNYNVLLLPSTYGLLANSIAYSVLALLVAMFFAIPIAWLVERTDIPSKTAIRSLVAVTILVPTFILAMGWVLLLSPTIGLINQVVTQVLQLPSSPLNIYTLPAMAFVQGLSFMPIGFFLLSAVFARMDPSLEEAAQANKVGRLQTILRITLPLSWPGLLAAVIYMFMLGIAVLEVPLIIGLPGNIQLYSSHVFMLTRGAATVPQYGIVGATSVVFLVISIGAAYVYSRTIRQSYRYVVVTGKGYRPRLFQLGSWRFLALGFVALYLFLAFVLPFMSLVWLSLVPFVQVPSLEGLRTVSLSAYGYLLHPSVARAVGNTAILILVGPTLAMVLSIAVAWIVTRSRMPGRPVLDGISILPLGIPNILIAVALMYLALVAGNIFPVYGTIWILVLAFAIAHITFGTRTMNAAMVQLHQDLEDAAAVSGARPLRSLRKIIVPLIWPAIVDGWIWMFLLAFRELTMAVTIHVTHNAVMSTVIWQLWSNGEFARAGAVSVVVGVAIGLLAVGARLVGSQFGGRVAHSG